MIKMKGVLAVPGEYTKDGKTYIKTAEELKDAAQRFPIVPLTYGHTTSSEPPPRAAQIGTVSQKWNEEQQKVLAEFWYHEEKVPDVLRSQIDNGEKIPISAWYLADSIDEDGTLHGMSYSHVGVMDGEDPVCPITECGAFVVAESQGRLAFVEHATDLEPEKEKEAAPEPEPTPDEVVEEVQEEPKPEPAEQKPEVEDEPAQEEEVILEPETVIPTELPPSQGSKQFEVEDGVYRFVLPAYKQKQEKDE